MAVADSGTHYAFLDFVRPMDVKKGLEGVKARIPFDVQLIAVSKRKPSALIAEAVQAGHYVFGENYVQEAAQKKAELKSLLSPDEFSKIRFHLIGNLQSNKAKLAVETFDVIQTVDRPKLAEALSKCCREIGKKVAVLLQVNISKEESKSGIPPAEAIQFYDSLRDFDGLTPKGLMCIGRQGAVEDFCSLASLGKQIGDDLELSMGMSRDFELAIEHGATMVRVGTAIFGAR